MITDDIFPIFGFTWIIIVISTLWYCTKVKTTRTYVYSGVILLLIGVLTKTILINSGKSDTYSDYCNFFAVVLASRCVWQGLIDRDVKGSKRRSSRLFRILIPIARSILLILSRPLEHEEQQRIRNQVNKFSP